MERLKKYLVVTSGAVALSTLACFESANAEIGMGLRGGTFGIGIDFDASLTDRINWRVAYNKFNYGYTENGTGVSYDSTLKINSLSVLLSWHAFDGEFRFDFGAVGPGPKTELLGKPQGNVFLIGNGVYASSQVDSFNGEMKMGSSIAPYFGIGWGNIPSFWHRGSLLVDIGVIYGGKPKINLHATCNASIVDTPVCAQLQSDVNEEIRKLHASVDYLQWYPVVNVGFGFRF